MVLYHHRLLILLQEQSRSMEAQYLKIQSIHHTFCTTSVCRLTIKTRSYLRGLFLLNWRLNDMRSWLVGYECRSVQELEIEITADWSACVSCYNVLKLRSLLVHDHLDQLHTDSSRRLCLVPSSDIQTSYCLLIGRLQRQLVSRQVYIEDVVSAYNTCRAGCERSCRRTCVIRKYCTRRPLRKALRARSFLEWQQQVVWLTCNCELIYLHRDIKTSNTLVTTVWTLKIAISELLGLRLTMSAQNPFP